jgi:electron transfer flavoprotein alpha subunit
MSVLVVVDHDRGELDEVSLQAIGAAAGLAGPVGAVVMGAAGAGLAITGVSTIHVAEHEVLDDYAPEAWAEAVCELIRTGGATVVVAVGTERMNEVLAHVGARLDLPMVSNVTAIDDSSDIWNVTRVRWGGSLLEDATLEASTKLLTVAPHAFTAPSGETSPVSSYSPAISESASRSRVVDRVTLAEGITLTTAPIVVSGGRGMGSAENFSMLEELASMVGGAVGCSRVATNNGWRSHSDQVGQTGTRVAPELYIACGISGAIQHWVGMMASKRVLAINTDREASMVTKADYAVIGDALEVIPAVIAEIKSRQG